VAFPLGIVGLGNVDRNHSRGVTGGDPRLVTSHFFRIREKVEGKSRLRIVEPAR
jgi:hypothetical protein